VSQKAGTPKILFLVKNISVLYVPRQKMVNVKFLKNRARFLEVMRGRYMGV